jgi:selenocysteine lyase/cysteine desulfurase
MQMYEESIEAKEDGGTPGILQSVRCGLAFKLKEYIGGQRIEHLEQEFGKAALDLVRLSLASCHTETTSCSHALATHTHTQWSSNPNIVLMGADRKGYFDHTMRVSIISLNILAPQELLQCSHLSLPPVFRGQAMLHPQFIIQLLNDVYGIQVLFQTLILLLGLTS